MGNKNVFKQIWDYRMMIKGLIHRDLRGRYKGSVLGFFWTFLNPLLQLVVYTILFGILLKSNIPDFYLYLFIGLIPWIFMSTCVSGGAGCILEQKSLVTKVRFPREVIPISYATTAFINMLFTFIVIFAVLGVQMTINSVKAGVGFPVNPEFFSPENQQLIQSGVKTALEIGNETRFNFLPLLSLPLVFLIEYMLGLGMTFLCSTITVYLRDMQHILGIVTMLWCYCTPIMYSLKNILSPEQYDKYYSIFLYANPMTSIIEAYHDILYTGTWPNFLNLLVGLGYAVVFLVVGFLVFEKGKRRFAEEM